MIFTAAASVRTAGALPLRFLLYGFNWTRHFVGSFFTEQINLTDLHAGDACLAGYLKRLA